MSSGFSDNNLADPAVSAVIIGVRFLEWIFFWHWLIACEWLLTYLILFMSLLRFDIRQCSILKKCSRIILGLYLTSNEWTSTTLPAREFSIGITVLIFWSDLIKANTSSKVLHGEISTSPNISLAAKWEYAPYSPCIAILFFILAIF